MSDSVDDRIRELFEELDQAAPAAPPVPARPTTGHTPAWRRVLVPASVAAVVILVLGVAGQLLLRQGDSADEATGTTEASADDGGPTAETRPPDRSLVLLDLNLACTSFIEDSDSAVASSPDAEVEYLDTLEALVDPTTDLAGKVSTATDTFADPALASLEQQAEDLVGLVEAAAAGNAGDAPDAYARYVEEVEILGVGLEEFGALDCAALGEALP